MTDNSRSWPSGIHEDQIVQCEVTGHRGRFGVDVSIVKPQPGVAAFIDFVLLTDERRHLTPDEFPPIGSLIDAVTLDVHPNGELRLCARPSSVARQRIRDSWGDVQSGMDP
ncbi:hypothetical protein ACFWBN_08725 [Streptomyces sp. NPDC059989]|uniref:hypothetical protein n=1 Tax=Streptomyces sp. NPDC059989 TaxID=3347026 RepID=UPI0036BC5015